MPRAVDQAVRDAILTDVRAGQKSRAQIARDHGVAPSTVGKLAGEAGIVDAFARTQTKKATEAAQADNAALRAEVSRLFLVESRRALRDLHKPYLLVKIGGKDNIPTEHPLPGPTTEAQRDLMLVAAVAFDKHLKADQYDRAGQQLSAFDEWMRTMAGGDDQAADGEGQP